MRTLQEKYNALQEGKFSKSQFLRDARLELPGVVSNLNGLEDTVSILKNRGFISEMEVPKYKEEKNPDYEKPLQATHYSLDDLERGIDVELQALGCYCEKGDTPTEEMYEKAKNKAHENLVKDRLYYLNKLSGDSSKVDKHDQMVAYDGKNAVDSFNGMVKAVLQEHRGKSKRELIKEDLWGIKALLKQEKGASSQEIRDFIKMHYDDIIDMEDEDIKHEFDNFLSVNYDSIDEKSSCGYDNEVNEEAVKHAFKKIIRNIFSGDAKRPLNEAAVTNLEKFINYENDENDDLARRVRKAAHELSDIIYKIEKEHLQVRDSIEDLYADVGPFMSPALSHAFKKDLEPVLKKYFKIDLPKSKSLTDDEKAAVEKAREAGVFEGKKFNIKTGKIIKD